MNDAFYKTLQESFPDLLKTIEDRKYIILIPERSIVQKSMLSDKNFFLNHIFYVSEYNEKYFINLMGKVLRYEHPRFISHLGWEKSIQFTVKDVLNTQSGIRIFQIDNVCDEINYATKVYHDKETQLKQCKSPAEYIKFYDNYNQIDMTFATNKKKLEKFCKEIKTNYIFMKGFEDQFSYMFQKKFKFFQNCFRDCIGTGTKGQENLAEIICSEMTQSYLFTPIYDYLFNNLVKFYQEEQEIMLKKLAENPARYEWEGIKIEPAFKDCKFLSAIQYLNNITNFKTPFEKINLLYDVSNLFNDEAKKIYENTTKKTFMQQGDTLASFWLYIIAHSKTPNLYAESQFLNLFKPEGSSDEKSYTVTNFIAACENLKEELLSGDKAYLSQYTEPNVIDFNENKF